VYKIASNLYPWIERRLDGLEIPRSSRSLLSVSCHDVVIEHHLAVFTLISAKIYGSAFTLTRPIFETFVRGVWLRHCADEDDLIKYQKDKIEPKFQTLLDAIEETEAFKSKSLSALKGQAWHAMNSYVHGGIQQISRRLSSGEIYPDFLEREIDEVVRLSQTFALLSFIQIAVESKRDDLAHEALELLYKLDLFKNH
jgi:hypothetical protein